MNSSVIFMEKENIDQSTIRHHMINKNTYVIYWTPLTLQVPKTQFSFVRQNITFLNSSDIVDKKH